jgi:archaellum biogenesis ATPase FlaH
MLTPFICTGSKSIDWLLGGGIRKGMVTDVFGESGTGKTQLSFTLCANAIRSLPENEMKRILFVDTVGTFRPERISEIAEKKQNYRVGRDLLSKILYVRALSTFDQINATEKILDIKPLLVVIDSVTALFSEEFKGAARHLALMNFLHELSLVAINSGCAVLITNMVRNISDPAMPPQGGLNIDEQKGVVKASYPLHQREFMERSISTYAHIRLRFEIVNLQRAIFKASLIQPTTKQKVHFSITSKGISDI